MKIELKDKFKIATPEDGMWLTDGNSVSDIVYMPLNVDVSKWREITTDEKEVIDAELSNKEDDVIEPIIDIDSVKQQKIAEIDAYDTSDAVNEFTLNAVSMWLPLEERKSMRQSLIALKAQEIETFTYWNGLIPITMPVAQFEAIMNAVEVYALQCFNVTAQHKAEVMALTNIAEVERYDITKGYPEKLAFPYNVTRF